MKIAMVTGLGTRHGHRILWRSLKQFDEFTINKKEHQDFQEEIQRITGISNEDIVSRTFKRLPEKEEKVLWDIEHPRDNNVLLVKSPVGFRYFKSFEHLFPDDMHYIVIHRAPLGVIVSRFIRHPRYRNMTEWFTSTQVRDFKYSIEFKEVHSKNLAHVHFVRLEDFCNNPYEEIRKALEFVDIKKNINEVKSKLKDIHYRQPKLYNNFPPSVETKELNELCEEYKKVYGYES